METTFMTIHNLTPEANILFASESIVDILGFTPDEVTGRSCFDYFHPDEVPFARRVHSRGVQLDKAAVLHYARIQNRNGQWVGCECVFTIVYEVLVACTSIYKGDEKNERRALEAPAIRRLFASSPRDPRYHMLEHLSSKFRTPPQESLREPRAALILNRFTRTLTVMYATNAVSSILGVTPEQFTDKSFYECMQENCLPEAIRCLESAKANDSIAYLRFWYRDPRREEDIEQEMREASQSSDSEDGGVELNSNMDIDSRHDGEGSGQHSNSPNVSGNEQNGSAEYSSQVQSRISSGESTDESANAIFDDGRPSRSSTSSLQLVSPAEHRRRRFVPAPRPPAEPYEIEAVVSCTSDGLAVVLRRARPRIPSLQQPTLLQNPVNGLFAAPWGANPIRPHQFLPNPQFPFRHGLQAPQLPAGGPPVDEFMNSIREVAVFAWSLTGINGNIASYGHGTPRGEAIPPSGFPIWDPYGQPNVGFTPPENQAARRWSQLGEKTNEPADGNAVPPYDHSRQAQLLNHQRGYNSHVGLDRASYSAHPPLMQQFGYPNQYQFQGNQSPDMHGDVQLPRVWSASPPPITQPEVTNAGTSSGNGHSWYL